MSTMVYEQYAYKAGAHVAGVPAQVAGEELARLTRLNDQLTAPVVLDAARSETSPLHPAFEWDNAAAAEEYRLGQARHLIAAVVVVRDYRQSFDDATPPRRAYVNVDQTPSGERAYVALPTALADTDMRRQVLAQAYRDYKALENKYKHLSELADVFAAVDRIGQQLTTTEEAA